MLQWGRGFVATEGEANARRPRWPGAASMGPWLRSHGRAGAGGQRGAVIRASMGPWLRSHGRRERLAVDHAPFPASMGPWLRSHGRQVCDPRSTWLPRSFNGAVAS